MSFPCAIVAEVSWLRKWHSARYYWTMALEIEAKILEVDVAALETRLQDIGAKRTSEHVFRIRNFDMPGFLLRADHAWVRLRTDGTHTTLAYKKQHESHMEEMETHVGDFETTAALLRAIGMIEKHSQEKKRTTWKRGSITYDIDTWPLIPTFLEVEGDNWAEVERAVRELGYDWEKRMVCPASKIYDHYGLPWNDFKRLTFSEQIKKDEGE